MRTPATRMEPSWRRGATRLGAALLAVALALPALALDFPQLTGRVVDEAGVLDAATRAQLTRKLEDLEARTTDQFVVVTLKSLHGTSIEDFGYQLGRAWKIGAKDKSNGVLLIVAPTERKVRFEVGYGLEGTLTDAATKLVIENAILPRFRANDAQGGVTAGVDAIVGLIGGAAAAPSGAPAADSPAVGTEVPPEAPPRDKGPLDLGLALVFLALALGFIVMYIIDARPIIHNTRGMSRVLNLIGLLFFELLRFSGSSRSSSGGGGGGGFSGGGGSFGGGGSSGSW